MSYCNHNGVCYPPNEYIVYDGNVVQLFLTSKYVFELCEIDVGDMLNITKSLQGKETHGFKGIAF